jgi:hypothetical protein
MPKEEIVRRRVIGGEIPLSALGSGLEPGVGADQFGER